MQYHLPTIESPAAGSRRILTELLENSGDRLATPVVSDTDIHEMRKTCKKLRALLRMIRPALVDDSFRGMDRKMRDFSRQLGTLRDNKVMLDTLDHVGQHFAPLLREDTLSPVHEAFRDMTTRAGDERSSSLDIPALQSQLTDIMAMTQAMDYERISDRTLLAGVVDCYRRGRRALARMESLPDTDNAHTLRRLAKYQYYQLQMLAKWNESKLLPLVSQFHQLEQILGQDHDLAMLEITIAEHPEICQGSVRRELLNALAESRRIALMSQALRLARELYRTKPGKFRDRLQAAITQLA